MSKPSFDLSCHLLYFTVHAEADELVGGCQVQIHYIWPSICNNTFTGTLIPYNSTGVTFQGGIAGEEGGT